MTDLLVFSNGVALWGKRRFRCALGRSGVGAGKREGDGLTPEGAWPMRRLLYRADRFVRPTTRLPAAALSPDDGWCDDPGDPRYNTPVALPCGARAEALWREDSVYDLIVPLGYNDGPVIAGSGSAIFLHVARAGYAATEGCVALAQADLLAVLRSADARSRVVISRRSG